LSERVIISGDPGTRWENDTEKVQYQFIAALINTCGVCLQYHLKISGAWPIPLHYGCRCIQRLIKPGQTAPHDFVDYRELLENMPQSEKRAAIGASNYKLLQSGAVKWDDIVTPSRVRDFREVVANKRLTVKQLTDSGVKPAQAKEAHAAVHTPEHEAVEAHRQELLRKLTGAGLSQENLVRELSKGLAARVTIAPGPTGPYTEGPAWSGGPLPVAPMATAAELAKMISGWRPPPKPPAGPAAPTPPPKPPPAPLPTAAVPEPEPAAVTEKPQRQPVPLEQPLDANPMIARAQQIGNNAGCRTIVVDDRALAKRILVLPQNLWV
jgi:hypothetical protein